MSLLDLPQIAEAQAAAYVTSNDADAALERALCEGKLDHDATAGDFAISATDFKGCWFHQIGGSAAAPFTVTIPAIRRPFMVENSGGETATLSLGSGGTVSVQDGECRLVYGDGTDLRGLSASTTPGGASFSGALVTLSSDFNVPHNSSIEIEWSAAEYDTDSFFSGSGACEFTVPGGVSKIILRGQIRWNSDTTNIREFLFTKNGSTNYAGRGFVQHNARSDLIQNLTSPVLNVTAGDTFECLAYQNSGGTRQVLADVSSWFSIQSLA